MIENLSVPYLIRLSHEFLVSVWNMVKFYRSIHMLMIFLWTPIEGDWLRIVGRLELLLKFKEVGCEGISEETI